MTCRCQNLLISSPASVVELIRATSTEEIVVHGLAVRKPVAEGLSRTVSKLQSTEQSTAVEALVHAVAARLAAAATAISAGDANSIAQQPQFVEAVAVVRCGVFEATLSQLNPEGCL